MRDHVIFPHMLRHACGYALANAGHDTRALQAWLGHKNIQHTVRYTEMAPDRFKDFWRCELASWPASLVSARRERPRGRRAAEQRDEHRRRSG